MSERTDSSAPSVLAAQPHHGTQAFVLSHDMPEVWVSPDEVCAEDGHTEGAEFTLVRVTVGAAITYRVVNGKPVPTSIAFPERIGSVDDQPG